MIGDITPTHSKEFRFCMHKGLYENDFKPKHHFLNTIISSELSQYFHLLKEIYIDEETNDHIKEAYI
jgi:hypothetical protein